MYQKSQGFEFDAKKADENIFFCTSCKKCWEFYTFNTRFYNENSYSYYDNFPSYGKKKVTCAKCEGKKIESKKRQGFNLNFIIE
jgi:hypothetical protein